VTPTQQEAFVAGGQARVEVTGVESAALDGLALTYQDTSYSVNSEGVATIPLQAAGSHDLTFTYEGTSESVTLNVQQASGSPSGGGASGETTGGVDTPATIETAQAIENENENEDGGSSGFGPGFGVVAAVVALLGAGLLAHRR
jgi:PGF-CTERM protein